MDNIYAIGIGLTLRLVIDTVTNHNHRVNGSLVGLWEGAVLHHFLIKFPTSLDPYVAYGFRLLVDLLFTASLTRLVIILLWTGLGLLLSDLSSDVVEDKRYRRLRRRIRRALPPSISKYFFAPTRTSSRVQFSSQVPAAPTSAVSSSITARSPSTILRPSLSQSTQPVQRAAGSSRTQTRVPSAPTPVPPRHPSSRPVPGSFSDYSTETEAARQSLARTPSQTPSQVSSQAPSQAPSQGSQTSQPQPARARTPSELEYITLPVIPDTPALETFPNYDVRSPRYDASRLTTPAQSEVGSPYPGVTSPPANYSGLTTPEGLSPRNQARTDNLPPVTIIHGRDPEHTPTVVTTELPEPAPIPIPLRASGSNLESVPSEEIPEIPTPGPGADDDGSRTERGTANRSPPPQYVEKPASTTNVGPALHLVNPDDVDSEGAPSVISVTERGEVITRADTLRKQARELEAKRDMLKMQARNAQKDRDYWLAFKLAREQQMTEIEAKALHGKAERRYFKAHNLAPEPQTIDVHRLTVEEAKDRVGQALYDSLQSGVPELRIITGKGKHSQDGIPHLKNAIIRYMESHHIETTVDFMNSGVLLVRPPAKPEEAKKTA